MTWLALLHGKDKRIQADDYETDNLIRKASFCRASKLIQHSMLNRGADIVYLGSTMPRSPSSSFGDGSVDLVYIPRRELLGVAGSCAVAAPISGAGLECFCLTSGVLGNEQPKQDHAVGLAVPIARRSCQLLLISPAA